MYTPKHLKPYLRPESYIGPEYYDYYPFIGQNRDSGTLTRSNFIVAQQRLSAIAEESENAWIIVRDHHWAVGWIETIYVHKNHEACVMEADMMLEEIEQYPVLDEEHWSELEHTEITDYWESLTLSEKIEYCKEQGENIFAARRFPISVYGAIQSTWD